MTTQPQPQASNSIITQQPTNPITPIINTGDVSSIHSPELLALLVAFGMVMAVLAAILKK